MVRGLKLRSSQVGIVVTVKALSYAHDGTPYGCNVVRTNSVLGLVRR